MTWIILFYLKYGFILLNIREKILLPVNTIKRYFIHFSTTNRLQI